MTSASRPLATLTGGLAVGLGCGVASALFLLLLGQATAAFQAHHGLALALPLLGLVVGGAYERWAGRAAKGVDAVLEGAAGGERVPVQMGPMVLVGTVLTQLGGGSVGREGTAVQMGGAWAEQVSQRLPAASRPDLLLAGIAGGFGSVFGTPWAGLVYGVEVAQVGRPTWSALLPAALASFAGNAVVHALGIVHGRFPAIPFALPAPRTLLGAVGLGLVGGLAVRLFVTSLETTKHQLSTWLPHRGTRAFLGGLTLLALWSATGFDDGMGLGTPWLDRMMGGELPTSPLPAFGKLAFTVLTLGSGFVGGEVTPIFVGFAALSASIAPWLGLPSVEAAAAGMALGFGAASRCPVALTVMAVELFGPGCLTVTLPAVAVAFLINRRAGLYAAQA